MEETLTKNDRLVVLWTSGDKEVAAKMAFMYTYNSKFKGWWKDVTLIVWGPSSKLLSEDSDLQEYLEKMKGVNIRLLACKACSDMYGVTEKLESMGIEVIYVGSTFTEFLKGEYTVITV